MVKKRDLSKRVTLALTQGQADAFTKYRAAKGHETEAAAVRALIKRGLEQLEVPAVATAE